MSTPSVCLGSMPGDHAHLYRSEAETHLANISTLGIYWKAPDSSRTRLEKGQKRGGPRHRGGGVAPVSPGTRAGVKGFLPASLPSELRA